MKTILHIAIIILTLIFLNGCIEGARSGGDDGKGGGPGGGSGETGGGSGGEGGEGDEGGSGSGKDQYPFSAGNMIPDGNGGFIPSGEYALRDTDNDGVTDFRDNCMITYNPSQEDGNEDGIGNACEDEGEESDPEDDE